MRTSNRRCVILAAGAIALSALAWYGSGFVFPRRIAVSPGEFCWAKDSSAVCFVLTDPPRICRYSLKWRTTQTFEIPHEAAPEGSTVLFIDASPDGREVAFTVQGPRIRTADHPFDGDLYVLELASHKVRHVRSIPDLGPIAWLSNDSIVYGVNRYVCGTNVSETWLIPKGAGRPRRVTACAGLVQTTDGSVFVCWDAVGRQIYDAKGKRIRDWAYTKADIRGSAGLVYASVRRCVTLGIGGPELVPSPCLDLRSGAVTEVLVPVQEVKLSPNGVWALYRSRPGTFDTYGPPTKPKLYITPLPEETRKALQAP